MHDIFIEPQQSLYATRGEAHSYLVTWWRNEVTQTVPELFPDFQKTGHTYIMSLPPLQPEIIEYDIPSVCNLNYKKRYTKNLRRCWLSRKML
ncbi:hypothetical protein J6590_027532 [Homalodisca vitripennis]|nr:hypothetical protein J6590_027532 [Homalodisca vitripennis]